MEKIKIKIKIREIKIENDCENLQKKDINYSYIS